MRFPIAVKSGQTILRHQLVESPKHASKGARRARVRLLTVLAEPALAERVRSILGVEFEVLVTKDIKEATTALENNSDLAVVLVALGGTQSVELLHQVYHRFPHTGRILISSSETASELRDAINRAHAQHLVVPPVDEASLLAAVRRLAGDFLEASTLRSLASLQDDDRAGDGTLANKDRLTGLYNHRSFQERFREEVSRAQRYDQSISALYVDIDNFSSLNRSAGFLCGDQILSEVASILKAQAESVRQSDIACRFGGQEFVVLLPETDKEGAAVKAERLRDAVSSAKLPRGVSITVSVGVATFPVDGEHAAEVLEKAELAVQVAKSRGRNCVVLSGESDELPHFTNTHAKKFPTFHDRMGDLVYALQRDRTMSCLYVDLSRLRRIEREFGVAQHAQLLSSAGQLLAEMRGTNLRREDLLCRTDDADGFLCFLSPPRQGDSPSVDTRMIAHRITEALEQGLTERMRGLTGDRPQIAVGTNRILDNPMIRSERLVHRLVEETKEAAGLEWQRLSRVHKGELQDLIISQRLQTAFQPLVDLDTGDRFAFEALARGPADSLLALPTTLFSVADAVDLTLELDRARFRTALRNAKGCEPIHRLFLNLLPASFYDTHFIETQVVAQLEEAGLTPANLVFEITERLAIQNFAAFRQALARYTDMGFGVAVDDVGTRHSNLEVVMNLQPHFIKLSEILCRGVTQSTVKREMVRSLVRIATTIDAVTVAEGIEDLDDLMTLRDLGVRFGQGYFLARPDFCFPTISEEAIQAIRSRPQRARVRPSGTEADELISGNVSLEEIDEQTGRISLPRDAKLPSKARAASEGARAGDDFEDEPTRTRGDIN